MKRTTISLPEELASRLHHEARNRDASVAEVVRAVLAEHFHMVPGQKRHIPFAALFEDGGDVSHRFDEYLAEVIATRVANDRDR